MSLLIRGRIPRRGSPPPEAAAYDPLLNRTEEYARRAQDLPPRERVRFYKALPLLASEGGVKRLAAGKAGLGVYEALLARSWVLRFDDPQETCRLAEAAVDWRKEPDLVTAALHNQLSLLIDLGRFQKAQRLLFENRDRLRSCGRISRLKLRGLEGQISYGLEKWTSAEITFREVKKGFKKAGLAFAHALMRLYLAMPLLRQGRIAEAEKEVLKASKTFFSLKIHREILGSVLLLKEAAERRRLTVAILENEVRHIRRADWSMGKREISAHSL